MTAIHSGGQGEVLRFRKWVNKEDLYKELPNRKDANLENLYREFHKNQATGIRFLIENLQNEFRPYNFIASPAIGHTVPIRITNPEWIINRKFVYGSTPVRSAYWDIRPKENFLQKIKTKVKNMFFKKRKQMQVEIRCLKERLLHLCEQVGNIKQNVDKLNHITNSQNDNIKENAEKTQGLGIICKQSTDYLTRDSVDYIDDVESWKKSGYEYISSYGDGKEMWIRHKKNNKKVTKTKSKKKK
jgi:hypothetical protein